MMDEVYVQKEGNGNVHKVLRSRDIDNFYIRYASSQQIRLNGQRLRRDQGGRRLTYAEYSRIIRDWRWRRFVLLRGLDDCEVFHITATEDDVVVDLVVWRDLLVGIAASAFGAVRLDVLQGDSRVFRIDLVESADISVSNVPSVTVAVAMGEGLRTVWALKTADCWSQALSLVNEW